MRSTTFEDELKSLINEWVRRGFDPESMYYALRHEAELIQSQEYERLDRDEA